MRKSRPCKLCHGKAATVPDRDAPRHRRGEPVDEICSDCHAKRLAGDLEIIARRHEAKS